MGIHRQAMVGVMGFLKCIGQEICEIREDYTTLIELRHARGETKRGCNQNAIALAANGGESWTN
jgi:hypothetical protein